MIPVLSRIATKLSRLTRQEFDEMFDQIRPHVYRLKQPAPLQQSTNQSLSATAYSTRNTPGVNVYEGVRSTSRKEIYLDLRSASNRRPTMYITNGTHFTVPRGPEPQDLYPITFEQRRHILRIKQSKSPRYRDERNRPRRDTKARRYRQALRLVNQTYGRYTDVQDVAEAWKNTHNISDFVEAIAVNEAIDNLLAAKSRYVNKPIYQKLEIGGTPLALRTAWKLFN